MQHRLTTRAAAEMRTAIADAAGREVFFVGALDAGRVTTASAIARGSRAAVPVLRAHLDEADVVLHNHPSGSLEPSDPDLAIAADLGRDGIGFYITDNDVTDVCVVAEPVTQRRDVPIDAGPLLGALTGETARHAGLDFEDRPSQREMLREVCASLSDGHVSVIEAGTGVGKSLAYSLPALAWTAANRGRIVISTATINLQHQLMEHDLPLAAAALGVELRACVVKGRSNYLCRTRLGDALSEESLWQEDDAGLEALNRWAATTETGERSDATPFPDDGRWARLCSEADACGGLRCPDREQCFVLRARRAAVEARVLIVNHHLLLSDLNIRWGGRGYDGTAVLPRFDRLIVDEAHALERDATSLFSAEVRLSVIRRSAHRFLRRQRGHEFGFWKAVHGQQDSLGRRRSAIARIDTALVEVEQQLAGPAAATMTAVRIVGAGAPSTAGQEYRQAPVAALRELEASLRALVDDAHDAVASIPERLLEEVGIEVRRLRRAAELCRRFFSIERNDGSVFWAERRPGQRAPGGPPDLSTRLIESPLNIAPRLREAMYEHYPSVVFTSATLTVAGAFDYWRSRVGLDDHTASFSSHPSPFDYEKRTLLAVAEFTPQPDTAEYPEAIAATIASVLNLSEGRALVLFTSYAAMQETARVVRRTIRTTLPIYLQGEEDRSRLLNRFRAEESSTLFATDSFWEGVDAPGASLEVVIICRLPFRPPGHPVTAARMEQIYRAGGDPFLELSLPDAVIRLRQGFGRLIRRGSDRGAVLILDPRVTMSSYGELFLRSLPVAAHVAETERAMLDLVEDFLASTARQ